jgi:recombination protein RecA
MTKPFDPSRFRKGITKSISGISAGFSDPDTWVSTGNFTLNYLISGDFHRGIPLGKVVCLAGESGSGKSFIASGSIVKNAQAQGIFVVLLDSENALDEKWLQAVGVDTSEDKLLRIGVSMIDDVAKIVSDFIKEYSDSYGHLEQEERPKVLFVVDSLGMLLTPTDVNQFEAGDMKGDLGRKAKSLTALVRNTVNRVAKFNIGFVVTNHTYASQDMFDPDDKISGGQGFIYASSIVIAMKKLKLKEDEDGNKVSDVRGIKSACKVMKSRYSKPFESVKVNIPYDTGMDPYSGLFDMLMKMEILTKVGNRYKYVSPVDGEEILLFQKAWGRNDGGCLDRVMAEFSKVKKDMAYTIEDHIHIDAEEVVDEEVIEE